MRGGEQCHNPAAVREFLQDQIRTLLSEPHRDVLANSGRIVRGKTRARHFNGATSGIQQGTSKGTGLIADFHRVRPVLHDEVAVWRTHTLRLRSNQQARGRSDELGIGLYAMEAI
jgi:hypothetical protein